MFVLLREGAVVGVSVLPVTWYAAIPLLCLVPVMLFILSFKEEEHADWLPLISLIKLLGITSLALFLVKETPNAVRFGVAGNFSLLQTVLCVFVCIIFDIVVGMYCFRRSRKLCK